MRRLKYVWLAIAVAGLTMGVAACGGDDDDGGPGETSLDLTIGDSVPLSGDLADFGPPGDKAAKLAVSEINKAIKQAGVDHKVTLVTEDNETNPQAAVQAARKMISSDGASCIAGAWASADSIPTFESATSREGVLQISPASTSDEITGLDDDGLVNRTSPPDSFQGPTLSKYLVEKALGDPSKATVNIGARIAASAGPYEVLVSSTVKDLVAGSGLGFEPRGNHTLKGIPDEWELFAAVPRATEPLV